MGMESFYGGRSGAAFVIVQRFDGIDIPQPGDGSGVTSYTYTRNFFAINANDPNKSFKIVSGSDPDGNVKVAEDAYLIARTHDNYTRYEWKAHENNGDRIDATSYTFPQVLARGMVQCFVQGTQSASLVNYGEYVIIDTLFNMHSQNDPDNGKVFRRGMDVQAELAGAEYIGQIVGPQGNTPEMGIDKYGTIVNSGEDHFTGEYEAGYEDIVPGKYIDDFGDIQYEDKIKYAWQTLKDAWGNVVGCLIGFKIPTLVQDFWAESIDPYTNRRTGTAGVGSEYYDLVIESADQYVNNQWLHPFYQKWQIKVPHGYHGDNVNDIKILPSATMPAGYKYDGFQGAKLYTDPACTIPYEIGGYEIYAGDSLPIERNEYSDVTDYMVEFQTGLFLYVKPEDCFMNIVRYKETTFDNRAIGDVQYFEIGEFNTIHRVAISEDGTLTVFYTNKGKQDLQQVLRWIDTQNTDGIEIDEDGTVRVWYNTIDPNTGDHEYQEYPKVLDWITEVSLQQTGEFKVLFNNDSLNGLPVEVDKSKYETTVKWIDKIDISNDGTVNFYENVDHTNPVWSSPIDERIKYLKDVKVNNYADEANPEEGTGNQKIHLKYNTTDINGDEEEEDIGLPLNYIVDAVICKPDTSYPTAPYSHLLVYYADPAYRALHSANWVTYPSVKLGKIITQWVDMGDIRGSSGGVHIIKDVASTDELKIGGISAGAWIPPEQLKDAGGTLLVPDGAGWGCTLTTIPNPAQPNKKHTELLFYDYAKKEWYSIGSLDAATIDASSLLVKSVPDSDKMPVSADVGSMVKGGFWLASETAISVV